MKEQLFTTHANRFSSKRKRAFRSSIIKELEGYGYTPIVSRSIWGNNIYFGNIDSKYILTAHYDTATNMAILTPFINNFGFLYGQLIFTIPIILIVILPFFITINFFLFMIPIVAALIIMIGLCIPNRYNYNDNTSGVYTVLEHARLNKDNENFFYALTDNEEKGLLGAYALKKYLKKQNKFKNKFNINIDCVAIGDTFALISKENNQFLKEAHNQLEDQNVLKLTSSFLASDHILFNRRGIMITKLNKARFTNDYYIPNLHTNKDREFDENNIHTVLDYIDKITAIK